MTKGKYLDFVGIGSERSYKYPREAKGNKTHFTFYIFWGEDREGKANKTKVVNCQNVFNSHYNVAYQIATKL